MMVAGIKKSPNFYTSNYYKHTQINRIHLKRNYTYIYFHNELINSRIGHYM